MYEKIFIRVAIRDDFGIRLVRDYLRAEEIKRIIGTLELFGATFAPRTNLWMIHPNNIPRLEMVLYNLARQVEARSEIGYKSSKERIDLLKGEKVKRLAARAFRNVVFKARGSYCEACGGVGEVHHRIIPRYIAPVDAIENFRILCRSCQTRIRLSFNRRLAKELAKKDARWLEDQYDEEVTLIVEGD